MGVKRWEKSVTKSISIKMGKKYPKKNEKKEGKFKENQQEKPKKNVENAERKCGDLIIDVKEIVVVAAINFTIANCFHKNFPRKICRFSINYSLHRCDCSRDHLNCQKKKRKTMTRHKNYRCR